MAARKSIKYKTIWCQLQELGPVEREKLEDRFWSKVDKGDTPSGCWLWMACKSAGGYGFFAINGRNYLAHRVSFQLLNPPIPPNRELDHICHHPDCVNPSHLHVVTRQQNEENLLGAQRGNLSCGIRGVTWDRQKRKWIARAKHNGRSYYGGSYSLLANASLAAITLRNKLMTNNLLDR